MNYIKLSSNYVEKLWGSRKLENYNFVLPQGQKIGEVWTISALPKMESKVINEESPYFNMTLDEVYSKHNQEIFGDGGQVFPLLSKIITAETNLSIQVHPDDEYALKHENCYGKPESWYIVDCPENAKLIYGHNTKNKEELISLVNNKKWNDLFKEIEIKKGDFIYVPPGKIHAITAGVTVFELQRSSDITYRFYDYDRKDKDGNLRPLHIEQSIDTTLLPDLNIPIVRKEKGLLIDNEFFTLFLLKDDNNININSKYAQITVLEGEICFDNFSLSSGESAIIYNFNKKIKANGKYKAFLSYKNNI